MFRLLSVSSYFKQPSLKNTEYFMSPTISENFEALIKSTGEDVDREGLKNTPLRAAKAFEYLTRGYHKSVDSIVNNAVFSSKISEMVVIRDIEFYSLCEHHILPFIGTCNIGYIPNGKVLGLSKFARIVDLFANRLQIQENMTQKIADTIMDITQAKGVGVVVEAKHMCMMMRGVSKQNASMTSSVMLGLMKHNQTTRQEFLQLMKN